MFDHVTLRVSDIERSRPFYETALATLGFGEPYQGDHFFEWEDLSISQARDDRPVTRGLHLALVARSQEAVDEWWLVLTSAGYSDDGRPGPRPEYHEGYYGAFVLDPDGNSAEAVYHGWLRAGENRIDHLWIRVRDVAASKRFYETIASFGGFHVRSDRSARVSFGAADRSFAVVAGTPTQNLHMAFPAPDNATVREFHRTAIAAGYRDNGPPGERRYHPGYYGAFVLDPDGNNIEVVCHNRD